MKKLFYWFSFFLLFGLCWYVYYKLSAGSSDRAEANIEAIRKILEGPGDSAKKIRAIRSVLKYSDHLWMIIGFVGEALFGSRMVVQWIASEKAKKNVFPAIFWYLSISGSILVFFYALRQNDPVFIISKGASLLIYTRNILLLFREKQQNVVLSQNKEE